MNDIYEPLVPDAKSLNTVKYAARDFVSMADDLLRRLKIEYGEDYNDYANTSMGIALRDLVCWAYADLIWYLDRQASDTFLTTARTRSAIERLVEQIGYKMRPASASGTELTLTFPDGVSDPFIMNARWRYAGPDNIQFESISSITSSSTIPENGTMIVPVRQGMTRVSVYTSDGKKNQMYRMTSVDEDKFVAINSIEVWVDGAKWVEKDFLEFEKTNHYEVSYLANPPIVRFGDGIAGNIPPVDSEVKIRYIVTDGKRGNVKAETIQSSIDVLIVGGQSISFTVNNPNRSSGGTDPEEADRARRWAPVSFAARESAITQPDYEGLSNSFSDPTYGAVAKSYAFCPRSVFSDSKTSTLLYNIANAMSSFVSFMVTTNSVINSNSELLINYMTLMNSYIDEITNLVEETNGFILDAESNMKSARSSVLDASSRSEVAYNKSISVESTINMLVNGLEDGSLSKEAIQSGLYSVLTSMSVIKNESQTSMSSSMSAMTLLDNTLISSINDAKQNLSETGLINSSLDGMRSVSNNSLDVSSIIVSNALDIKEHADTLNNDVTDNLYGNDGIANRITELFSDDCLSNYVQVPILATDINGNYTSPSFGLRSALQNRLNRIKEVTQVVEVVDGSNILVPVNILVKLSIVDGFVLSEVKSRVHAVIANMLKGRDFNMPLYLSDIYHDVEDIVGVDHVNITLSASDTRLMKDGNIITDPNQVIILGSLTFKDYAGKTI